jgi:hypothetical protein
MQTATLLGVLLAAFFSLFLVLWQYYFKSRRKDALTLLLSSLRFLTYLGVFLLLLNPKITRTSLKAEKQNLILLMDDSRSLMNSGGAEQARALSAELLGNPDLSERFNVTTYSFGQGLESSDSLNFEEEVSDISGALTSLNSIYGREKSLAILLSDGNQTFGKAYEYMGAELKFPLYALVVGDTTQYTDLKIGQVNINKYAFLNNRFPLELFVSYQGKENVRSRLTIGMDGQRVFARDIELTPESNSSKITTSLLAEKVGFKTLEFSLDSIPGERNTANNSRRVSIEVIDEKTRIALISRIAHPDIGALTKAIERNQQRSVTVLQPNTTAEELSTFDLLILYQPDRSFENVYNYLNASRSNRFTIAGPDTDWRYLNGVENGLEVTSYNQAEEVLPVLNPAFSYFDLSEFSVEEYPPLRGSLGEILLTRPYENILDQQIKGVRLTEPLLSVFSDEEGRQAYLFGENIWKWRVQNYRNDLNFENFDQFINKLILFLTSDSNRDRLSVNYETVYAALSDRRIKASFYDATFVFDKKAELTLTLKGTDTDHTSKQNMTLSGSQFEADLRGLTPGEYDFSVTVAGEDIRKEGRFRIEDFNLEQLSISSDYRKLDQLSESSGGRLFYPDQLQDLISEIATTPGFSPIQKSVENVVSLIDFKILLGLILLALSAEWFIRKYNGLI